MKLHRETVASLVLIIVTGCAGAPPARTASGASAPSLNGQPSGTVAAVDVARVVCESDGVRIEDPVVKALRDGVHLSFENPGGAWGFDLHHESWAYGTSEGGKLSSETTPDVSAMGPGNVTVACTPTSR